jgi:predicted O-methyltransferase YrrM
MTTLNTSPLAPVLERMFREAADPASSTFGAALAQLDPAERARMRDSTDPADYRRFYGMAKDTYLAVSRETAELLYMLARSTAREIVEFGTSFGLSTLFLAAGLRDGNGGRVIGTEFEPSKVERARANFAAAGLDDLIELREGDALQTLASDLPAQIDLVLLDGVKSLYPKILTLLEPRLRAGAMIVADNTASTPDYLDIVRAPDGGYLSLPLGGDVELSMRL